MLVILVLISGVYAQHIVRVGNFVHQQVVHKSSARSHQPGIVRLPDGKLRGVVARDQLHQAQRARAANFNLAHVAHVEQAGARAHSLVLGQNAGVFQWHIPAAKIHHFGAEFGDEWNSERSCAVQRLPELSLRISHQRAKHRS